jgi:hypothetical protein
VSLQLNAAQPGELLVGLHAMQSLSRSKSGLIGLVQQSTSFALAQTGSLLAALDA